MYVEWWLKSTQPENDKSEAYDSLEQRLQQLARELRVVEDAAEIAIDGG